MKKSANLKKRLDELRDEPDLPVEMTLRTQCRSSSNLETDLRLRRNFHLKAIS